MTRTVDQHGELPAARTRLTAEGRRQAIIEAARPVFARKGYHGSSTAEIAAGAGCSEPTLYKHFPTKLELFAAVLRDAHASMRERHRAALADPDPVSALAGAAACLVQDPSFSEKVRLRGLALAMTDEPLIQEVLAQSHAEFLATVADAVRRSKAIGSVRADVDPDHVAWLWLGLTLTAAYRQALEGPTGLAQMHEITSTFYSLLQFDAPKEAAA